MSFHNDGVKMQLDSRPDMKRRKPRRASPKKPKRATCKPRERANRARNACAAVCIGKRAEMLRVRQR